MTILGVAEFAPDMPDLSDATSIATNVMPTTPASYGPLRDLAPYSTNTLDSQCLGMGFAEDTALVHQVFAGTTEKLWRVVAGSKTWGDVSGTVYATGAGENWRFAQYKNLELATNFADPIQAYDMIGGGTFADLSADAPLSRFIAVAKGFAIAASTFDGSGGANPARVWWSAVNDPTNWPTPGTAGAQQVMSDYNDIPGVQGQITGLAPSLAGCDCAVFFERGVQRMIFSGPPAVFDFYAASSVKGMPAPNSLVPLGSYVYYLGEDGFYVFDGNTAVPIGANKVDKWFYANVDNSAFDLVIGAPDIANKAICWAFKSIYSTTGLPDMMLLYRWDIQRWAISEYSQQWISRIPVVTADAGSPPSSLPLTAGQLQLAAVDANSYMAFFSGANLAALVGTKVVQITSGRRTFVNATRPLVDSAPPQAVIVTASGLTILTASGLAFLTAADAATITVAMSARNNYQEAETFGPEQPIDNSGQCSQRSDGRYHRGRVSVPGGTWTTMAGLDVAGVPAGMR